MSNPFLKDDVFRAPTFNNEVMTRTGTINKSLILWFCLIMGAVYSWTHITIVSSLLFPISILTLILATIIIIKKKHSGLLAPFYALSEGLMLGVISFYFDNNTGIVLNAILLTLCVLLCMLSCYKLGLLKATTRFKKVIILSTFSITLVYFVDFVLNIFGIRNISYIHSASNLGILASLIIVVIAAFNLIIDFDLIENGVLNKVPKHMEWYSSFALMTTVIWLYLEILKLFFKIRNTDSK
ncbi:MAG: Bax inhibitor-1/YccA family protein [Endomicrobium sp.]|jgi:uncharacterized YccA/Bax inhibitor family protein|nr:Bax inhibitor-1/YccA family protein [Endomicrobium sp.]